MEANELRIGNWINGSYGGFSKDIVVYVFDRQDIQHTNEYQDPLPFNNFKPIPLTEEWLLKFGFEKSKVYNDSFYAIKINEGYFYLDDKFQPYMSLSTRREFKYVHEIQNLFHVMTGEELAIK